nr:TPA_asm: hypothetical protein [Microrhabdovirus]
MSNKSDKQTVTYVVGGVTKSFDLRTSELRTDEDADFDTVYNVYKGGNKKSGTIYFPANHMPSIEQAMQIIQTTINKMRRGWVTDEDIKRMICCFYIPDDGMTYPTNLYQTIVENAPDNIKNLFEYTGVILETDDIQQQTSDPNETQMHWNSIIDDSSGGEMISMISAFITIRCWFFTQLRITSKEMLYPSTLTTTSPMITTATKLDTRIHSGFLLKLYHTWSMNPDIRKYFTPGQSLSVFIAYALMMSNTLTAPKIACMRFWNVGVKYHEMLVFNMYQKMRRVWNKTAIEIIQTCNIRQAMEYYAKVQERFDEISDDPSFYCYASWFISSYVSEFSLRRFPQCAYLFWAIGEQMNEQPSSSTLPGLKLSESQENKLWELAQDIMDEWSDVNVDEVSDVTIGGVAVQLKGRKRRAANGTNSEGPFGRSAGSREKRQREHASDEEDSLPFDESEYDRRRFSRDQEMDYA